MSGEIETTVAEILTPLLHTEGFELVAVETSGNRTKSDTSVVDPQTGWSLHIRLSSSK